MHELNGGGSCRPQPKFLGRAKLGVQSTVRRQNCRRRPNRPTLPAERCLRKQMPSSRRTITTIILQMPEERNHRRLRPPFTLKRIRRPPRPLPRRERARRKRLQRPTARTMPLLLPMQESQRYANRECHQATPIHEARNRNQSTRLTPKQSPFKLLGSPKSRIWWGLHNHNRILMFSSHLPHTKTEIMKLFPPPPKTSFFSLRARQPKLVHAQLGRTMIPSDRPRPMLRRCRTLISTYHKCRPKSLPIAPANRLRFPV